MGIAIELTEWQIHQLRPMIEEIAADAAKQPEGISGKTIIAQVMTTLGGDAYLRATVLSAEMTEAIRDITFPDHIEQEPQP